MGKPHIRDAATQDVTALCALRNVPRVHEAKLVEASRGACRYLVALDAEQLVGFATLFLGQPLHGPRKSLLPKLSDCFVAPAYRLSGIGRELVRGREEIARRTEHDRLYVSVDPFENPHWLEFFRRRLYTPLHPEPYEKVESRYAEGSGTVEVVAWRQDLVRLL